jgi:hypothetical protein
MAGCGVLARSARSFTPAHPPQSDKNVGARDLNNSGSSSRLSFVVRLGAEVLR